MIDSSDIIEARQQRKHGGPWFCWRIQKRRMEGGNIKNAGNKVAGNKSLLRERRKPTKGLCMRD